MKGLTRRKAESWVKGFVIIGAALNNKCLTNQSREAEQNKPRQFAHDLTWHLKRRAVFTHTQSWAITTESPREPTRCRIKSSFSARRSCAWTEHHHFKGFKTRMQMQTITAGCLEPFQWPEITRGSVRFHQKFSDKQTSLISLQEQRRQRGGPAPKINGMVWIKQTWIQWRQQQLLNKMQNYRRDFIDNITDENRQNCLQPLALMFNSASVINAINPGCGLLHPCITVNQIYLFILVIFNLKKNNNRKFW